MIYNLTLTPKQVAVIYELLYHVRLGSRNEYESEISDLIIRLENKGIEQALVEDLDIRFPKLRVEYSNDEGLVINLD